MLTTVAIIAGVAIAAFGARVATRPDTFRVRRTATINAPPERVYPFLEDFHRWSAWSPWEKLDPEMKRTFSGAERGPGAVYAWEGNSKAGQGRMEITEAVPSRRVSLKLDFVKPFPSHNVIDFTLEPRSGATEIVWDMHGPNTTTSKLMQSVISMDKMVGKDFEAGLANLKRAAESVDPPGARSS